MKEIKIKDVLKKIEGEIVFGNENEEIVNVSTDTRTIKEGDTFIALRGETNNGNIYCKTALENGAKVCIVDELILSDEEIKKYKNERTIVKVANGRKALIELARYKRSLYNIPVVAVTGSVGKTSTKDTIATVLSKKYNVLKTEGNFNNDIGLPLTILRLKNHEVLVVEMGMNHFGEISLLTNIAKPSIAVISNIGTSHIGILGSRKNILKAKLEILEGMDENGVLVLNNDNDLLSDWNSKNTSVKTNTFGIENASDYLGYNVEHLENNSKFNVEINNKEYSVLTSKPGEPFVMNSLSAIAVGKMLDVPMEKIIDALASIDMTKNRMDIEKIENNVTIIKDYYNASYESIKPGLEYLMSLKEGTKIAVLGDIKELGEYSKELHEKVGKEVVKQKVDLLITVGEDAKYIAREATKEGMKESNIYVCETNESAAQVLTKIMKKDDKILLKASNSMKFGEIYNMIKKKIKVTLVVGGMSTEHDVSLMSGKSILNNINKNKYDVKTVYLDKTGSAFEYVGEIDNLTELKSSDLKKEENLMSAINDCDIVFPVLHGAYGEDGCIQGVFEILRKPYVGCGVLASSLCMDKVFTKEILNHAEIAQAKYIWVKNIENKYIYVDEKRNEKTMELKEICSVAEEKLKYPMFVKPSNAGSSIGVTRATNIEELEKAIEYGSKFDKKIIVEQGIIGREIECAVLGNDDIIASCTGEVLAADTFYSYDAKYENSASKTIIPANIEKNLEEEIKKIAIKAFKAVDGKGLSRVDFFIEIGTNKIILNEINTLPGFTNISMYPKLFGAVGIEYSELIDKLISMAKVNNFDINK